MYYYILFSMFYEVFSDFIRVCFFFCFSVGLSVWFSVSFFWVFFKMSFFFFIIFFRVQLGLFYSGLLGQFSYVCEIFFNVIDIYIFRCSYGSKSMIYDDIRDVFAVIVRGVLWSSDMFFFQWMECYFINELMLFLLRGGVSFLADVVMVDFIGMSVVDMMVYIYGDVMTMMI